jgi:uncharacterized protein
MTRKRKIINDPVYGFIPVNNDLIFGLIEHPYFQRLRRIKQLGLTHLVYPGALHTRFHHSLGAMYLMQRAISELRSKGHVISHEEGISAEVAILLHDIGHGPYSHALEHSIADGISHEEVSDIFLMKLNKEFNGELDTAIAIFENRCKKHFLHKLVASQLDMDRIDYLKRDSFFTGVAEGVINYERLLNMLNVVDDGLVIEAKGIYSVEKFITARRLMYWQVYLHKTVLAAEYMLMRLLKRAKYLSMNGTKLFGSPSLQYFLKNEINRTDFLEDKAVLDHFARLDDFDIFGAMKVWKDNDDAVLSLLSTGVVDRHLFRIEMQKDGFEPVYVEDIRKRTAKKYGLTEAETNYLIIQDETSNHAYKAGEDKINILFKDGTVKDIAEAADELNISLLSKPVTKHFLCYPKGV